MGRLEEKKSRDTENALVSCVADPPLLYPPLGWKFYWGKDSDLPWGLEDSERR